MKLKIVPIAALLAALGSAACAAPVLHDGRISGEVVQTQDVGAYTYVRLKNPEGEIWAAVNKAAIKDGSRITIDKASMLEGFQSKTLNKTFDRIVFGQLADANASATASKAAAPVAPAAAALTSPVPKAQGADARTVAEVVKGKSGLKDKPVTVHAKVVKVNLGIMGKNWFHLQDGSGAAADGSNDVLVTTKDVAALGDIVTVKGTVRTDVKVGAGYDYAVMIEDASLRK